MLEQAERQAAWLERIEAWEIRKRSVESAGGLVVSQHWRAARAGAEMLRAGGNAFDAAVAAAFALNACEPWMSGLGGSGCAVLWDAARREARALDFQGVLAAATDSADYPLDPRVPDAMMGFPGVRDNRNVVGYGSITVPGTVRGLSRLHAEHGRLGFDTVLGPAIRLAEDGLPVDWHATLMIAVAMPILMRDAGAAAVYLPGGAPPQPQTRLPLPALAATLRRLAEAGPEDFYEGQTAERMAADLAAGGSALRAEDLATYEALWLPPLSGRHRGAEVHTAGPNVGGARMLEFLAHVEAHLDVTQGIGGHCWKTYADGLEQAWRSHKRKIGQLPAEAGCTSHLSACDADGNMVALTHTLLNRFGSGVVLPRTGVAMNNAVSYFDPRPGLPTSLAGRKRINASNMSPTVCVRDGEAYFAVGASGANRIFPATAQIVSLILDFGLGLEEAFHVPRVDASLRGSIQVDPRMGEAALAELARHYKLETVQLATFPKEYASPQGVMRRDGKAWGMSDPSHPVGDAAGA